MCCVYYKMCYREVVGALCGKTHTFQTLLIIKYKEMFPVNR